MPITTPTRTLLDGAPMLERHRGHPGVRAFPAQLEADHDPARTRAHAEERLLALIRDAGCPHPEVNARLGRWEIDFLWRQQGVAMEVDGYAAHSSPGAFRDEPEATLARLARAL